MKKRFLVLLVPAALLVVAAIVMLLVNFDSPEMGQAFLKRAAEATGMQMKAEQFQLNLLKGLFLEKVRAEGNLSGAHLQAKIDRLALEHRLLPLLRGKISVERLIIEDPELDLTDSQMEMSPGQPEKRPGRKPSKSSMKTTSSEDTGRRRLFLEISELQIDNALLTWRPQKRKPATVIKNLDMHLVGLALNTEAGSVLHGLTGHGKFSAEEIDIGKTVVWKSQGNLQMNQGELQASEITFKTTQGNFIATLEMNLKTSPVTYKIALEGDPIQTHILLGSENEDGYGPGKLELKAEGTGTDSRDMRGNGMFSLAAGKLPSTPVLLTIEGILGRTSLVGSPYKAGATPFRVEQNRVIVERFSLETEKAFLNLSGWVSLDGPLGLRLKVRAPRENVKVKEIPNEVLDALTDSSGWVGIPFQIRGTTKDAEIQLDNSAILAQAGESAERMIKKKLSDKIKDFLKKKNNE